MQTRYRSMRFPCIPRNTCATTTAVFTQIFPLSGLLHIHVFNNITHVELNAKNRFYMFYNETT